MLALTPLKATASVAHRLQLTVVRVPSAGASEEALGNCAAVTCGAEHWASSFTSWAKPPLGATPASSNAMVPATGRCRRTRTINNVPDSHEFACILCWPNAAFNPRPGLLVRRPAQGVNIVKQREFRAGAAVSAAAGRRGRCQGDGNVASTAENRFGNDLDELPGPIDSAPRHE